MLLKAKPHNAEERDRCTSKLKIKRLHIQIGNEVLKTAVEISRKKLGTVISSSSLDACNINAL